MIWRLINSKKNAFLVRIRRLRYYYFFKSKDIVIGSNIKIIGGKGNHQFGKNFKVFDNCIFECHEKNASISTGENCIFSFGVLCSINTKIKLGNHVWVGEYTSIRNATHNFSVHTLLGFLPDKWEDISIGNNVWIGRGCVILPGTTIENNVVVAANSVVKGYLQSNSMYGGCPVKLIKKLE